MEQAGVSVFGQSILIEINECLDMLSGATHSNVDLIVTRLDSIVRRIHTTQHARQITWGRLVTQLLEEASEMLVVFLEAPPSRQSANGRPKLYISMSSVEYLLSMNFKASKIAELYGVSRETLCRRMKSSGISVK
jgi:transcriptional regulator of acetoin/glycerol metabolism